MLRDMCWGVWRLLIFSIWKEIRKTPRYEASKGIDRIFHLLPAFTIRSKFKLVSILEYSLGQLVLNKNLYIYRGIIFFVQLSSLKEHKKWSCKSFSFNFYLFIFPGVMYNKPGKVTAIQILHARAILSNF